MFYMAAGKTVCAGELSFIKTSDFMRLIHHRKKSMRGNHPHDSVISHWVPPTTQENGGSYNTRRDLSWDTAKAYHVSSES